MLSLVKTKTQHKNIKNITLKIREGEYNVRVNVQEINKTKTVM